MHMFNLFKKRERTSKQLQTKKMLFVIYPKQELYISYLACRTGLSRAAIIRDMLDQKAKKDKAYKLIIKDKHNA